jgi:hypothetical protein
MSATTMAVATTTETVDPPGSRLVGHVPLAVSIAAISVRISGACQAVFIVQADSSQFKNG